MFSTFFFKLRTIKQAREQIEKRESDEDFIVDHHHQTINVNAVKVIYSTQIKCTECEYNRIHEHTQNTEETDEEIRRITHSTRELINRRKRPKGMRCQNVKCYTCQHMIPDTDLQDSKHRKITLETFDGRNPAIYIIKCRKCMEKYIGSTGNCA